MRRKEKEIVDQDEMESVIQKADICRLGLSVDNRPYIVPLNFGYKEGCFYFHTAQAGRKIDMIRQNSAVCFELEADCELMKAENPCDWGMKYRSVIGYGTASVVTDAGEKKQALDIIMNHYGSMPGEYGKKPFERIAVIKVHVEEHNRKKIGVLTERAFLLPILCSNPGLLVAFPLYTVPALIPSISDAAGWFWFENCLFGAGNPRDFIFFKIKEKLALRCGF